MKAKEKMFYMVLGICLACLVPLFFETESVASSRGSCLEYCSQRFQISAGSGGAYVIDIASGMVYFASADAEGGVRFHGPPALPSSALLKKRSGQ